MTARGGPKAAIGMPTIKERRLSLPVSCHQGSSVGDYVPFNFCPRSVMLYVIHKMNHPELSYRGGQAQVVHLEADLQEVIEWANTDGRRWAFSLSNASTRYAEFRSDERDLDEVDWDAVHATDFRPTDVQEAKQAEFLVHEKFPVGLVRRIGLYSTDHATEIEGIVSSSPTPPTVELRKDWYF